MGFVNGQDRKRMETTTEILRMIRTRPKFREWLPTSGDDSMIVALPTETIREVDQRVTAEVARKETKGQARTVHIIVPMPGNRLVHVKSVGNLGDDADLEELAVSMDTDFGMFVELLAVHTDTKYFRLKDVSVSSFLVSA